MCVDELSEGLVVRGGGGDGTGYVNHQKMKLKGLEMWFSW